LQNRVDIAEPLPYNTYIAITGVDDHDQSF
jgi:hypothetical protein